MGSHNNGNKEYYNLLKDYLDKDGAGTSEEVNQSKPKRRQKKPSSAGRPATNYSEVIANISNSEGNGRNKIKSTTSSSFSSKPTFSVAELVKRKVEARKNATHPQNDSSRSITPKQTSEEPLPTKKVSVFNSENIKKTSQQKENSPAGAEVVDLVENEDDESSEEDFDDDDFEDIHIVPKIDSLKDVTQDDSVAVTINLKNLKKQKNTSMVISKEHRLQRKEIHMMYIVCMLIHGRQLNSRLNNKNLQAIYNKIVPQKIYYELHPNIKKKDSSNLVKSRYFLDGLRHLMELWIKIFRITFATGIFKLNWDEIETDKYKEDVKKCMNNKSKMSKNFYFNCLARFNGNRDLGAQGFVALLRSLQVKARLIYSIQPPNFTITSPVSENPEKKKVQKPNVDRIPKFGSGKPNSSKSLLQKISNSTHGGSNRINETYHLEKILKKNPYLSPYPIFWAEAWNPYSKKWISIDAVNFRILEDIHRVSKLEPPLNDERNSLLYVIAFDKLNNIKDVTRRYASKFNSKTRKKRITRDNHGYRWYDEVLSKVSSNNLTGKNLEIDRLENEYLTDRSLKEGMPTSINDFRNHPIYVLESQLKPNEIISPKDICGYVKTGTGNTISLPVYLRENVHELRSSVGWFHKGRIIKIGERALGKKSKKSKKGNTSSKSKSPNKYDEDFTNDVDDDDDDDDVRLYAEFQTEFYKPEPIKNGIVPKNGFGNIDVYSDNMIPEGGVLMKCKFGIQAAKILDIDYAPAVTGFKFSYRNSSKPKIEGVVISKEYEEAVQLVNDNLQEEDVVRQRKSAMTKALRAWNLVFAKLRIVDRLNSYHGKIEDDIIEEEDKIDKFVLSSEGEEYLSDNSEEKEAKEKEEDMKAFEEAYGGGGFLPTDMDQDALREKDKKDMESLRKKRHFNEILSDEGSDNYEVYIPEDENNTEGPPRGGFILEDNDDEKYDSNKKEDHIKSIEETYGGGGFLITDMDQDVLGETYKDLESSRQNSDANEILPEDYEVYIPENETNADNETNAESETNDNLILESDVNDKDLPNDGFTPENYAIAGNEENINAEELSDGSFLPTKNGDKNIGETGATEINDNACEVVLSEGDDIVDSPSAPALASNEDVPKSTQTSEFQKHNGVESILDNRSNYKDGDIDDSFEEFEDEDGGFEYEDD